MLKKIFLAMAVVGLLVAYGLGFVPVDYKFGAAKQEGLASILVDTNISNFSLCILDLYTMEKTTDLTLSKVKTTTTVQFNNNATAKIVVKYEAVDDEGNVKEDSQAVLTTLGLDGYERVVYYRVINRKIYLSNSLETLAQDAEAYAYQVDTFYQIREKGDTEHTYLNSIAVGVTVILVGTVVACLIFFAIKKPEERD